LCLQNILICGIIEIQNLFFERGALMHKKILSFLVLISLLLVIGCQKAETSNYQTNNGDYRKIVTIDSGAISSTDLILSTRVSLNSLDDRNIITGIDQISIPENVRVDIINGEYALLRTHYNNLGLKGKLKLIINDRWISEQPFCFSEKNTIETINLLKSLGMETPQPFLPDSYTIDFQETVKDIHAVIMFEKNKVIARLRKTYEYFDPASTRHLSSGSLDLPDIPERIIIPKEYLDLNIDYVLEDGKMRLDFESSTAILDNILVTFPNGEFIFAKIDYW